MASRAVNGQVQRKPQASIVSGRGHKRRVASSGARVSVKQGNLEKRRGYWTATAMRR